MADPNSDQCYIPCTVCNRKGEKIHYGALTCNACRTFFRRVIRLKLQPECQFYGRCLSDDVADQIWCMKCRLDKCLAVGMLPEAVQPKRNSTFWNRNVVQEGFEPQQPKKHNDSIDNPSGSTFKAPIPMTTQNTVACKRIKQRHNNNVVAMVDNSMPVKITISTPEMAVELSREDFLHCLKVALSIHRSVRQTVKTSVKSNVQLTAALGGRLCTVAGILPASVENGAVFHMLLKAQGLAIIDAAKNINQFCECALNTQLYTAKSELESLFNCKDSLIVYSPSCLQIALLKSFSPADIILSDLRCSKSLAENMIVVPQNLNVINQRKDIPLFRHITEELLPLFESIDPDEVETALLKRVIFWNSDVPELTDHRMIRQCQLAWIYLLEQYICRKVADNQYSRLVSMVMLAGKLQRIAPNFRKHVETFISGVDADPHVAELFMRP